MNESFVQCADGCRLYVRHDVPPRPHPSTIVFLHGYPDDHTVWAPQIEALSKVYRTVAYDLRGAGRSDAPSGTNAYALRRLVLDLHDVVATHVPDGESFHLVGHDWGAMVGWMYVSDPVLSRRVRTFMAIAGPHPAAANRHSLLELWRRSRPDAVDRVKQWVRSWYVAWFQVPLLPELVWRVAPRTLWKRTHRRGGVPPQDPMLRVTVVDALRNSVAPIHMYRRLFKEKPWRGPLPQVLVPTCVVTPEQDFAIGRSMYFGMDEYVQTLEHVECRGNHWIQRERPADVTELIAWYVERATCESPPSTAAAE